MLSEHQQHFTQVCFGHEPDPASLEALGANQERWLLYRDMVRSRLRRMVGSGLKRTVEALGKRAYEHWFDRWLANAPPKTRYIREVVLEFSKYSTPLWAQDSTIKPWITDVCRYETAKWQVGWMATPKVEYSDFAFEKVPVLNPALALLSLSHRVHERIEGDYPKQPVHLCVFRRPDDTVATWILKDRTLWFMQQWQKAELNTTDSVRKVAEAHSLTIDEKFVTMIGTTLADLIEAGMILGAREP